jgi:hypothetical protein
MSLEPFSLGARRDYERQYSGAVALKASAEQVFALADDFIKLSSHMGTASLMMMCSSMHTSFAFELCNRETFAVKRTNSPCSPAHSREFPPLQHNQIPRNSDT